MNYIKLSVFVYPVAPEDGTGVTLWLNYYDFCIVQVNWNPKFLKQCLKLLPLTYT